MTKKNLKEDSSFVAFAATSCKYKQQLMKWSRQCTVTATTTMKETMSMEEVTTGGNDNDANNGVKENAERS
jgi:hypothetical protein